ncbi:M23 family metallopeptidase [Proteinivorax hydrogeniformans]|uniref:M23 family metallopeptidase n=1 Tax=Proteinivorax hydrogeniformans TaxID=1826727 RepID=A0AAU8HW91_9FIRM
MIIKRLGRNVCLALVLALSIFINFGCASNEQGFDEDFSRYYVGDPLYVQFPFKAGGTYYISQGGHHQSQNYHYWNERYRDLGIYSSMRYAVDIHMIGEAGIDRDVSNPSTLEDFTMFGVTIYSPVDGVVAYVEDGNQDMPPGQRDDENHMGNYLVIEAKGVMVTMLHLKEGSIQVNEGQQIKQGQPIAKVGKSGMSTVPHLHIQATKEDVWYKEPVPMLFDGEFLIRGDKIKIDCSYKDLEG